MLMRGFQVSESRHADSRIGVNRPLLTMKWDFLVFFWLIEIASDSFCEATEFQELRKRLAMEQAEAIASMAEVLKQVLKRRSSMHSTHADTKTESLFWRCRLLSGFSSSCNKSTKILSEDSQFSPLYCTRFFATERKGSQFQSTVVKSCFAEVLAKAQLEVEAHLAFYLCLFCFQTPPQLLKSKSSGGAASNSFFFMFDDQCSRRGVHGTKVKCDRLGGAKSVKRAPAALNRNKWETCLHYSNPWPARHWTMYWFAGMLNTFSKAAIAQGNCPWADPVPDPKFLIPRQLAEQIEQGGPPSSFDQRVWSDHIHPNHAFSQCEKPGNTSRRVLEEVFCVWVFGCQCCAIACLLFTGLATIGVHA